MKKELLTHAEAETPWLSIFRRVAFIGDSLSSGELVSVDKAGNFEYNDYFEYSWGKFMARKYGFDSFHFSRGGMTAGEYLRGFADRNRYFSPEFAAQAYFVALGINDINCGIALGSADDGEDAATFAGQLRAILARYRGIQPRAKFFLVTMPKKYDDDAFWRQKKAEHRALLYGLAERIPDVYVIDLHEYAPEYDREFERRHYMNGHLTPSGYLLTAEYISRLADALIDERIDEFREIGFIGTDLREKR